MHAAQLVCRVEGWLWPARDERPRLPPELAPELAPAWNIQSIEVGHQQGHAAAARPRRHKLHQRRCEDHEGHAAPEGAQGHGQGVGAHKGLQCRAAQAHQGVYGGLHEDGGEPHTYPAQNGAGQTLRKQPQAPAGAAVVGRR